MANDVRCTHGATIGRVNREELFYLMTRGLSRGEAERLIVRGFFQDILDRIELEPVREALGAALEARIPHERRAASAQVGRRRVDALLHRRVAAARCDVGVVHDLELAEPVHLRAVRARVGDDRDDPVDLLLVHERG